MKIRIRKSKTHRDNYLVNLRDVITLIQQHNHDNLNKRLFNIQYKISKEQGKELWEYMKKGYGLVPDQVFIDGDLYILGIYLTDTLNEYKGDMSEYVYDNLSRILDLWIETVEQSFIDKHTELIK
tara:strand:+ start:656 stop:1030 length:375 start_codon:yes stop_codon:yes gene_type:complete